ncbi:hypothetical protein BV22DRAFT_1196906 [Leucogyrophana mollusca]|uniref:Uncharacterized protein n=1 Tax=Leucogyrophana mollusca TaxID=85980 RepID=A0ACB8BE83_9AGAM|nr:hypothetical protein BV22DRAFT_1196906 [Leucogyrophana mollusca]
MESTTGPDMPATLPHPGTHLLYPALLAQIRTAVPNFPLDPIVLRALLLCIIAGNRNLILRTREEDVGVLSKLVTLTFATVFGCTAHRVKLHSDARSQAPSELLRSLFLPSSAPPPTSNGPFSPSLATSKQRDRHKRTPTASSRISTGKQSFAQASITTVRSRKISFPRSSSYPSEAKPAVVARQPSQPALTVEDMSSPADHFGPNAEAHTTRPNLHAFGVRTEPSVPTIAPSHHQHQVLHLDSEIVKVPSAVVVSGLEYTSLCAQRAVLRTLTRRKLILDDDGSPEGEAAGWDVPENFIMVFVCRSDERERPGIHKSLLDRFAMSTPISVQAATRLAVRQHLPRAPSSPSTALPSPYSSGSSPAHYFPSMILPAPVPSSLPSVPASPAPPIIPPSLVKNLQALNLTHTHIRAPIGLYLSDLFTATRHYPALDAALLTARSRHDAESLVRATRVLGVDLTGAELVKDTAKPDPDTSEEGSTTERAYSRESFESDRTPNGVAVPLLSLSTDTRSNASMSMELGGDEREETPELDVSEADIARIFPRVVSHRLRVHDSPMDEVLNSAVRGAVRRHGQKDQRGAEDEEGTDEELWERDTIKDILVKILSEV